MKENEIFDYLTDTDKYNIILIIILLVILINIYIIIKLYTSILKLNNINSQLKEIKIDTDESDTKLFKLVEIQKEQTKLLKELVNNINELNKNATISNTERPQYIDKILNKSVYDNTKE